MRPGSLSLPSYRRLILWSAPLLWLGCGGGGTDIVLPSLSVTTSTSGVELDPDGYAVVVDAQAPAPIGLNASLTVERLPEGIHTVSLAEVASNCVAQGANPRTVTVQPGSTASLTFTVSCGPSTGTIEVGVATSGAGSDPDGFALTVDGNDAGPIGVNATSNVNALPPGPHTVGLTGLTANCQALGDNPRGVTVTAGQTTQVSFAVTCVAPPAATGSLQIATTSSGSPADADGYTVGVDGAAGQVIGTNASLTLSGLSVGSHTVLLAGIAANCRVSGPNPVQASVAQNQVAPVAFTITCGASTGGLTVTVLGLPAGAAAAVTVTGPAGYSHPVSATEALTGLVPGSYSVAASPVTVTGITYTPRVDHPARQVTAGGNATVEVSYQAPSGSTLDLRIDGVYLTQSSQTRAGTIPLVRDRAALLRVFVVGSQTSGARPDVRVRLFQDGALARTITIRAPAAPPSAIQEASLGSSWNTQLPGSLIRPGLSVLAEVDPGNTVTESNETDNVFPASGTPQALDVRSVPAAAVRFVPVLQSANNLQGEVGNTDALIGMARRMYPLQTVETDRHAVYTVDGPLLPENDNDQWNQVLSEIDLLRVAENSTRTYFGLVKLDYSSGIVGVGFVGETTGDSPRAAIGWDEPSDVQRVVAHELGHTWGQLHTPCNRPLNIDPSFPYPAGNIGVYGYDAAANSVILPSASDIMGYCSDPWISDYIYNRVLTFRQAQPSATASLATVQPCLLIWGRIVNGRPVLEPAFQVMTRPRLPAGAGPYSVEGVATDGSRLFSLSFDAAPVADDPRASRHFAFAVPLDPARASRVGDVRLSSPQGTAAVRRPVMPQFQRSGLADSVKASRHPTGVTLTWNPAAHPMIMVRDPDTGEVLSLLRGGRGSVLTRKDAVELNLSDGVQSHRMRLFIRR